MKEFIKYTLASCLGVAIAFFAFIIIGSFVIGGIASSFSMQQQAKLEEHSVLEIDLEGRVPELTNNSPMSGFSFESEVLGLQDIIRLIELAREDEDIAGIVIRNTGSQLGMANSTLLTHALEDFAASGKPVVAYGEYFSQASYKIATAADHIIMSPAGNIDFRGFGALIPFFKNTLDMLGIDMQVYFAGDYKSATEPIRRTEMSPENEEQLREFLKRTYENYLGEISENRGIPVDRLREIASGLMLRLPEDALRLGMVDQLGYSDDAMNYIRQQAGLEESVDLKKVSLNRYKTSRGNLIRGSEEDRIAVLYAEGDIIMGEDQVGAISEQRYIDAIRSIVEDEDIKAVVLRVNSPGGNVLVADHILHELMKVKEKGIPLIVSMGDLAASGGYYISAKADKIYAQPNTITGSIGVFGVIPNVRDLSNKIGVTFDTVNTTPYSTRLNAIYMFNDVEDKFVQDQVDYFYKSFVQLVAEGREMTVEQVYEIAQGRIWTGEKAVDLGLVDEIGSLDSAIVYAAKTAELEEYRLKEFPRVKSPIEQLMEDIMGKDYLAGQMRQAATPWIGDEAYRWLEMARSGQPQARMIYRLSW